MADVKDIAVVQLVKNFPKLGKFLEDVTITLKGERSYNASTGTVTSTDSTQPFKAFVTKALSGSQFDNYQSANVPDSPFKINDLKLIVPCSYLSATPKNDDEILLEKTNITYRIFGLNNVSDVAYIMYLRSATDEAS